MGKYWHLNDMQSKTPTTDIHGHNFDQFIIDENWSKMENGNNRYYVNLFRFSP